MLLHQNKIFNISIRTKSADTNNLPPRWSLKISSVRSANLCVSHSQEYSNDGCVQRIREMLDDDDEVNISVSAYDTAWIAMIPSCRRMEPRFPKCVRWILENQEGDGSWNSQLPEDGGLKDSLLSTLACLLPLRKWQVGHRLLLKGLEFIASNSWVVCDPRQHSPIGFNVRFPGLVEQARELDLNLPFDVALLDHILHNYQVEIARIQGNEEALTRYLDYNFHTHLCVKQFTTKWIPTIYPSSLCIRLSIVDIIQKLGLNRYFTHEIQKVLDETYRSWKRRDREILSDVTCCALAFRHLRLGGYDGISQDELVGFLEEEHFFSTINPRFTGLATIMELYKASICIFSADEDILVKINASTRRYLTDHLLNQSIQNTKLSKEMFQRIGHGSFNFICARF